jgi:LPXTG-motif cell wall-anchored protein
VPRALVALIAAFALLAAVPAAGLAQDAGSNQYQDPLAGEPGTGGGGGGGSGGGGGGGGGGNGTAPSSGTQGVQNDSGSGAGTTSAQTRDQLPATGSDTWILALAGVTLLGGGLGLRRVATRPTV